METIIKKIDAENMTSADFKEAAELLRAGKLVAFPTETVYGLGGDAFDPTASARIYAAKGRPSDNPLIVHIADIAELKKLCREVPEEAYLLADKFWPGPLTMIMKKADCIPKETTGGLDTVAIRMPSHPIARRLIQETGLPIAAPSANASGRPSTTKAEHVIEDLDGRIEMIIDGGSSDIGLESTIVDLTVKPVQILRPGFITIEMLKGVIPDIVYDKAVLKRERNDSVVARAPGMKYRHYAPKGELVIFEGDPEKVMDAILEASGKKLEEGYVVGILASEEFAGDYVAGISKKWPVLGTGSGSKREPYALIEVVGSRDNEETIAANLFDKLRDFDAKEIPYIFGECFPGDNLGAAIMNRLVKAAGYHIEKV
ncbi:MAG: threonylcarbamoyl-AMP synthase [Lachnospiraceae bacterium]|nr:threonylcarbamoyl-AMP synthase [Lachnospiraceae bacterium]